MKSLTKSEEQVMQVLWKLGQGFLKDLLESSPDPKPHGNTIATLLKILVEKGFVKYEVQGRNNLYKPAVSKEEYGKKTLNQVLKGYFEGSPARIVSHFISENKISDEEMEELLNQIKSLKKSGK